MTENSNFEIFSQDKMTEYKNKKKKKNDKKDRKILNLVDCDSSNHVMPQAKDGNR